MGHTQRTDSLLCKQPPYRRDDSLNRTMASTNGSTSQNTATVSVFAPLSVPTLRSVDSVQIARFLNERERYEVGIDAKQLEMSALEVELRTASIDRSLLKNLIFIGNLKMTAEGVPEDKKLTHSHVKEDIDTLLKKSISAEIVPSVIELASEGFSIHSHILVDDALITHICANLLEDLENAICGLFRNLNPKKRIQLLVQQLKRTALKCEMRRRIPYPIKKM